jgi:outer membrane protein assembly factor BamB
VWSFPTRFEVVSSPAVYNETVYVASDDGNVYAIGNRTTSLTATASTTVVAVNTHFSINGTPRSGTTRIAGATIPSEEREQHVAEHHWKDRTTPLHRSMLG